MLWQILVIVLLLVAVGALAVVAIGVRNSAKKLGDYASALESVQKRLDQQTARLNILTRALPNLQSILSSQQGSDQWPTLVLDDARALVWADSAAYWSFHDPTRELELVVHRGLDP